MSAWVICCYGAMAIVTALTLWAVLHGDDDDFPGGGMSGYA